MIPMKYASENDCAELSPVVADPEIFCVASVIGCSARAMTAGSMPARSSRAVVTTLPRTRRSSPISRSEETLVARYSAAPVLTTSRASTRTPSRRLAPTSRISESITPGDAVTRLAWNVVPARNASVTRWPNVEPVPSSTTIRFGPPDEANAAGRRITAARNSGTRIADTQNHLLRTRSTNSRRMTAKTLRTRDQLLPHSGARGVAAHEVDEDLVQGRLHDLKPGEPCSGSHKQPQQLLRVCPGRELELGILPVVVHLLHQPPLRKQARRVPSLAVEPNGEMLSARSSLDVAKRAAHEFSSARDDAQLVAQLLGLLHDVRREEHGHATLAQLEHDVLEHLGVHRIEPRERLVEDDQRRLVQQRRNELDLLLHAPREPVDAAQTPGP